ncbi:hypothetical protein SBY92_005310 [Candida maltosa Xu316]|uniref:Uncharacterized protein n=1 Tax=Candida maltosa (strain Xu316) TaxID=1245528 RepID=M3IK55_CANMX|nr:hypothetical protein G210_2955 [Candida maltosa Xu316]
MKVNHTAISECGNYIAKYNSQDHILEVNNILNSEIFRSYNLKSIIQSHIQIKPSVPLSVTQLQWESIRPNSVSTKIGIVITNLSLLVVLNLGEEASQPIFIKQSQQDGIESFEWIPPALHEKDTGAYQNSRQLIVYTKLRLSAKVYSLDCTHVLFTIFKPISSLIICPEKNNKYWSIVANTLKYNSLPRLYHFYNEGSVSVLILQIKLPQSVTTSSEIEWSPSGTWLRFFDDKELVLGYNMLIYNLFGAVNENNNIEPLIDVESIDDDVTNTDGISFHGSSFEASWLTSSLNEEFTTIANLQNRELEIQIVSMNLLRTVKIIKFDITGNQGWVETNNRFVSKKIDLPENLEITKTFHHGVNYYICINNRYLFHYILESIDDSINLKFKGVIQTSSAIVDCCFKNDQQIIITNERVYHVSSEDFKPNIISNAYGTIKYFKCFDDKVIIVNDTNQRTNWSIINLNISKKRRLIENTSILMDEVTDTFEPRKRSKT